MLSVVIPCYNERDSLEPLARELADVANLKKYDLEAVFVDDGSTDGSWEAICRIAAADSRFRGLRFRRNFGKAAALAAGFRAVGGEVIMTLDADLQDDPSQIPKFIEKLGDDLEVVSGWKQVRHDPWHKVWPSRVFNWLVGLLTGVRLHDHNCGMKCYRREVVREIRLYGELHRFIPVLAAARGFRVGEVVVAHRPRVYGYSKYGTGRMLKGFLDLLTVTFLTGFRHRPLHLLGAVGMFFLLVGGAALVYLIGYWTAAQLRPDWQLEPLHQRPAFLAAVGSLLFGSQLLSLGLLAELITHSHAGDEEAYAIAEETARSRRQQDADVA